MKGIARAVRRRLLGALEALLWGPEFPECRRPGEVAEVLALIQGIKPTASPAEQYRLEGLHDACLWFQRDLEVHNLALWF